MTSKRRFGVQAAAIAAVAVGSIGTALAVPTTWVDDITTDRTVGNGSTIYLSHNITDGALGYRSGIDTIISAFLTITLRDDERHDGSESVRFNFDGSSWTSSYNVGNSTLFSVSGIVSRLQDGFLTVGLRASGDFIFDRSFLTVFGDRRVGGTNGGGTSVPEPGTLLLFGLGLLGIGLGAKRKRGIPAQ